MSDSRINRDRKRDRAIKVLARIAARSFELRAERQAR